MIEDKRLKRLSFGFRPTREPALLFIMSDPPTRYGPTCQVQRYKKDLKLQGFSIKNMTLLFDMIYKGKRKACQLDTPSLML